MGKQLLPDVWIGRAFAEMSHGAPMMTAEAAEGLWKPRHAGYKFLIYFLLLLGL